MVRRRRRRTSPLKNISIAELQAHLDKKVAEQRKRLPALKNKSAKLAAQLAEVDSEIASIEGPKPRRRRATKKVARKRGRPAKKAAAKKVAKKRGRPAKKKTTSTIRAKRGGKITIPAAIHRVLSKAGKPMKAVDIRNALIKQKLVKGIKKSFPMQVSHALSVHKEFKRKGRGVYSL